MGQMALAPATAPVARAGPAVVGRRTCSRPDDDNGSAQGSDCGSMAPMPQRPAPSARRRPSRNRQGSAATTRSASARSKRPTGASGAKGRGRRRPGPLARLLRSPLGFLLGAFVLTVAVGLLVAKVIDSVPLRGSAPVPSQIGPAPVTTDMTGFDAARIIDDEVFYDSTTMTVQQITDFIEQVNAGCQTGDDGTLCLAEATFDTEDREVTTACPGGYKGVGAESAAQIISKVATACDINPQVLLVLIQKEQGLLTASGETLAARVYEAAAGYACPDGTQCDPKYAGFFRQIYGAAMQFQTYRLNPGAYQVVAGVPVQLAYSPDSACGTGELTVANQATAGLYDYTPYQPNAVAAHGGNDCTSWGNWNFYGYFRSFFGDPTPSTADG